MAGGGIGGSSGDEVSRRVLQIVVEAKNAASAELAAAEGDLTTLQGVIGNVGKDLALVGGGMLAAGAVMAGAVGMLASSAADYQTQVTALVTGAGESRAAIDMVSQGIRDMAGQVGEGPTELAKGMYLIESAGFHGAAGLDVLKASAEGAKVGLADQGQVGNALTTILNAYSLSADQANGVTGQMIATVAAGKMRMDDLTSSLAQIVPIASAYHISFQQIGAATATLTSLGMPAQNATRSLGMAITQLGNETPKGSAALKEIGLSAGQVATQLASGDLVGTLSMIEDHLGKKFPAGTAAYDTALKAILGPQNAFRVGIDLMGDHMKTFKDNIDSVGTASEGAAKLQENWNLVTQDATFQFEQLKAQVATAAIDIGLALLPALQGLMASLHDVITQVVDFVKTHADLIASVMEGTAKFLLIGGTILTVVGLVMMLVATFNPLTLAIVAIIALVGTFASTWGINWQSVSDAATAAQAWIAQAIQNVQVEVEALEQVFNERFGSIQQVVASVSSAVITEFNNITSGLNTLVTNFGATMQSILDTVNNFIAPIRDALSYLDPNATHSPSLVSQVSSGVQSIIDTYVTLGQITIPLQDSGAAVQAFAAMGKEALQSLADTTQVQADNMKSSLDMMKQALADAKADLAGFARAPLTGSGAFEDQKFALDQQINALKLKIDLEMQAGLAADPALAKQLKALELQKQIVGLQESVALDPAKRAIKEAASPTGPEQTPAAILAGIQGAQSNIAALTPAIAAQQVAYSAVTQSLKEQHLALTMLSQAASAAAAAAHAAALAHTALATAATAAKTAMADEGKVASETVAAQHDNATAVHETFLANQDFALEALEAHKGHKNLAAAAHESGLQHLGLAEAARQSALMHQDLATKAREIAAGHLDRAKAAQESADKHAILAGAAKDAAQKHQDLAAGFHAAAVALGELTTAHAAHAAGGGAKGAGAGAGAHPALPPPIPVPPPPPPSSAPWVNYYKDIDAGAHEMSENDKKRFIDQKTRKSEIETILAGLQAAYQTFSDKLTGIMTPLHDGVIKAFDGIKQSAHDNFGDIPDFVTKQMQQVKDWHDTNMPLIEHTTSHILGLIRGDWDQHTKDITAADNKMWTDLQANNGKSTTDLEKTLATAWETIKATATTAWDLFKKMIADHWDAIKLGVSTTISDIETGLVSVMKAINGDWEGAWAGIELILGNHWGGMVNQVRGAVNSIIGFINTLIDAWNGIHFSIAPFDLPLGGHFGGLNVGVDHINDIGLIGGSKIGSIVSPMAVGGIVTHPGIFQLGEGGEPEAVVPLSRAASMGFGGGGDTHVHVSIDLANAVIANDQALQDLVDKLARAFNAKYGLYSRHA